MLRLSLEDKSHIIDDREINRSGTSYTHDTILSIKKINQGSVLYLIIGMDNLKQFHRWHQCRKILEECNVIVMHREYKEKCDDYIIHSTLSKHLTDSRSIFNKSSLKRNSVPILEIQLFKSSE